MFDDPKTLLKKIEKFLNLEEYHWRPVLEDPKI